MLKKIVLIGVVPLFLIGAMSFGNRSTTSGWSSDKNAEQGPAQSGTRWVRDDRNMDLHRKEDPCQTKCEPVEHCKVRAQRKIESECCRGCNRVIYQQLDCCRRCPPRMKYSCRPCKGEKDPCPEVRPCKMCQTVKPCCGKSNCEKCKCNVKATPACSSCKDSSNRRK